MPVRKWHDAFYEHLETTEGWSNPHIQTHREGEVSGHARNVKESHQTFYVFCFPALNTVGRIGSLIGWQCAASNARGAHFSLYNLLR